MTLKEWKEFAIDVLCSNELCKSEFKIDGRMITDLIYCSARCAKRDGLTEKKEE